MSLLRRIALRLPQIVGSPQAFLAAILVVLGWLALGFAARWSTTWLLWPSAPTFRRDPPLNSQCRAAA